jgi:TrmH family RNA methyltransferase
MDNINQLTRKEKALLESLTTRNGRKKSGCCLCEGARAVGELLLRAPELVLFVVTSKFDEELNLPKNIRQIEVSSKEFQQYAATVNSQGVLAVAKTPEAKDIPVVGDFILAFDQINDPGNFGTMARTFRAIGGKELWITTGTVDPYCDKAIRSAMGAQFALNIRKFANLPTLCQEAVKLGYKNTFITDPHKGTCCFEEPLLFDKSVIIIGNEANGVTCFPEGSKSVHIPMPGEYESLNAAQAATVFLVEYVRRNFERNK